MNKLDLHPSTLVNPSKTRSDIAAPRPDSVPTSLEQRRLLVLIPADADCNTVPRQVCELANVTNTSVQLLSLCKDVLEEPGLRRRLAMLCALIQEGGASVEAKIESGANWVEVLRRNHQKGDLIVCFADQRAGMLQRPLSQILQSNLDVQVYILSSSNAQNLPNPNWFSRALAWAGSVGIIIFSFLLQTRITALPQDWAQTTLLISSVVVEIGLIWAWNNLLG